MDSIAFRIRWPAVSLALVRQCPPRLRRAPRYIRAVHLDVHKDFHDPLDHFSKALAAGLLTRRLYGSRNSIEMLFHYGVKQRTFIGVILIQRSNRNTSPKEKGVARWKGSRLFLVRVRNLCCSTALDGMGLKMRCG